MELFGYYLVAYHLQIVPSTCKHDYDLFIVLILLTCVTFLFHISIFSVVPSFYVYVQELLLQSHFVFSILSCFFVFLLSSMFKQCMKSLFLAKNIVLLYIATVVHYSPKIDLTMLFNVFNKIMQDSLAL